MSDVSWRDKNDNEQEIGAEGGREQNDANDSAAVLGGISVVPERVVDGDVSETGEQQPTPG